MADALRVAFFGGSFNPPHVAHVLAVAYALSAAPIDEVLVVPVYQHPFAKELAPYDARLEMCKLALELLPRAHVSTLERDLGGESLTLRTVEEIARREPAWQLRLLIGSDVLADLPKWHRFDRIAEIAPPLVLGRHGAAAVDGAPHAGPPLLPPVSSTDIRAAAREGRLDDVRDVLPTAVARFIEAARALPCLSRRRDRRGPRPGEQARSALRSLARSRRTASVSRRARVASRLPDAPIDADLVIVALRDKAIAPFAADLVAHGLVGHRSASIVHCAGALGPEALAAARGPKVSVAQRHPMLSFASARVSPSLLRGQLHVDGDADAVARARELAALLGMTARTFPGLDRVAYHAAAGLVANGAAALAAAGVELLGKAGVDGETAARMLGPLLRSVAENIETLGLPDALTGPVRRGDAAGVARHLDTLRQLAPALVPLYVASTAAQIPVARSLHEEPDASFDAIAAAIGAPAK